MTVLESDALPQPVIRWSFYGKAFLALSVIGIFCALFPNGHRPAKLHKVFIHSRTDQSVVLEFSPTSNTDVATPCMIEIPGSGLYERKIPANIVRDFGSEDGADFQLRMRGSDSGTDIQITSKRLVREDWFDPLYIFIDKQSIDITHGAYVAPNGWNQAVPIETIS